ncbi:MAG: winged helix-turn-helix domain-containing protein [Chloroflexi bacterium]|nr:winged helix-turn-helix domain-containing protein [Chloroflexota bacterium]
MATNKSWTAYPATYRAKEMKILADWIAAGESGSVVGLAGCGRSNVLGFLCHRLEVLQTYLPPYINRVAVILVDLNNLPTNDLSTLYRTILHTFYQNRERFDPTLQPTISEVYLENRAAQDPFLSHSALNDLLLLFQEHQLQVVLVLNRFDRFCQTATPQMLNTLRGLRDSFKDTLCYIVGMRQEVTYLPDPVALGDMYELLDSHVCWVGAMSEDDARRMVTQVTSAAPTPPTEAEVTAMLALTGCFPVLIKAIGQWWLATLPWPTLSDWAELLSAIDSVQYRLERMWNGLTQEEQSVLSEVQKLQIQAGAAKERHKALQHLAQRQHHVLQRLVAKGLCEQAETGWQINGDLLVAYVAKSAGRSRGKIWLDEPTKTVYQGQTPIEGLTSLQKDVLIFLVKNPRRQHTKTDLIINTWPDELREQGVSDDALYQVIVTLRRQIEPDPANPRYLITWRGRPEGGYQFFPEGKPG